MLYVMYTIQISQKKKKKKKKKKKNVFKIGNTII